MQASQAPTPGLCGTGLCGTQHNLGTAGCGPPAKTKPKPIKYPQPDCTQTSTHSQSHYRLGTKFTLHLGSSWPHPWHHSQISRNNNRRIQLAPLSQAQDVSLEKASGPNPGPLDRPHLRHSYRCSWWPQDGTPVPTNPEQTFSFCSFYLE